MSRISVQGDEYVSRRTRNSFAMQTWGLSGQWPTWRARDMSAMRQDAGESAALAVTPTGAYILMNRASIDLERDPVSTG